MSERGRVRSPLWVCILAGFGAQYLIAIPLSIWIFGANGISFNLWLLAAQVVIAFAAMFVVANWFDRRDDQFPGTS